MRSVAIKENSRGKIIVDGYTLTHKQTIFCEEYVASNHDAYKAAVEAGYKCKTRKAALNMASENLEKPAIQAYIAELERRINKRHEQRVASIEDRRNLLTQFIYDQEIKATDRLKALDILNKMDAAYEQRIKMDTTINNPVQSLTTEELRSIAEQAPILEQYVADYMKVPRENLKKLASEGKITADIVHKAIMAAQDDVDAKFAAMPQTFSSLGTQIHNTLIRSFQPLFGLLTKLANAPEVKEFVAGIVNNIKFIAPIITGVFNVIIFSIRKVMAFFQQHAAVFGVLKAAMAVVAIGAGLLAAEYAAMGIAAAFAAIKTAVLNSALLTSPITWIVLGIVALIIVIYQLINMYEEWAGTSVSVIGAIAALFAEFGVSVANIFVGLWNYIAAFVNFFANVWKDPLGAVQNLFIDIWNAIAGYVAKAVNNIIDSINKIPGMDKIFGGPIGHVDSLQLERVAINGGETTIMDRMDYIDASPYVDSAYNWGAGVGQGISDGISNAIGSLNNDIKMPGDDNANTNDKRDAATQAAQDTAKNTGKTAKHTEKTAKALQLTADEIKNLHRSVQNDAIKEWSNRTIHINVTNNNKIDKDVNYGDFTTNFANGLIETVKRNTAEAL